MSSSQPHDRIPVDDLDGALSTLYIDGDVALRCGLCAPCDADLPQRAQASFHLVLSGGSWLITPRSAVPARLDQGDLLVVPPGAAVLCGDAEERRNPVLAPVPQANRTHPCRFVRQDGSEAVRMLCAHFRFRGDHPVAAMMPPVMHVRAGEFAHEGRVDWIMASLREEAATPRVGGRTVIRRLVELLFIQVFRAYASRPGVDLALRAALQEDRHVARTVQALHEHPEFPWTVERLAQEAACSRTVYLARFAGLVGQPPLRYLTALRMSRAQQLLSSGRVSTERVAEAVGYGSVQAFARAFKRSFGLTPAQFRGRQV